MTDDLFDDAEPASIYGLGETIGRKQGRYHFPAPSGEPEVDGNGYMRMTNLTSAFSDQRALQLWLEWQTFEGLRAHDVIFDEWMAEPLSGLTDEERKKVANRYAKTARTAVKADEAARRGNARHKMMETYYQTGEVTGTRSMRSQLDSLIEALDKADLEVVETEFHVWHPAAGGTIGRSDARVLCRRTGQIGILDLKTQARFWTWQEICGQLYGYDSARWQWDGPLDGRGRWLPAPEHDLVGRPGTELVGKRVALVAHMPQAPGPGQLPVTLKQIPLDYGRQVLECAARNIELRSVGRSTGFPVEDFPF